MLFESKQKKKKREEKENQKRSIHSFCVEAYRTYRGVR